MTAHFKRTAHAHWTGNLKDGNGQISTQSGALKNNNLSFNKRFGNEPGTNPEELIAAAHSSCFSMAMSFELEKMGTPPDGIDVDSEVTVANVSGSWVINKIHLTVNAKVPGASEDNIRKAAENAKANCPVSKVLKADITMDLSIGRAKAA